ncbi:hypothetical protein [Chryseobacterium rhizosphaerae]|uniref:hypothetical protein n=1 Tax=Chryseobacterium rhizosphaerae TaxID=395937 RepID=UPI00286A9C6E|nr:hypothetical protein [Chryseobacterium rhizosphaerae]
MLKDFAQSRPRPEVQGTKLNAIYKLIVTKGGKSETEQFKDFHFLEIAEGQYIGIKRTGSKEKFFPCILKTVFAVKL